jgi:hypothetical protein
VDRKPATPRGVGIRLFAGVCSPRRLEQSPMHWRMRAHENVGRFVGSHIVCRTDPRGKQPDSFLCPVPFRFLFGMVGEVLKVSPPPHPMASSLGNPLRHSIGVVGT